MKDNTIKAILILAVATATLFNLTASTATAERLASPVHHVFHVECQQRRGAYDVRVETGIHPATIVGMSKHELSVRYGASLRRGYVEGVKADGTLEVQCSGAEAMMVVSIWTAQ